LTSSVSEPVILRHFRALPTNKPFPYGSLEPFPYVAVLAELLATAARRILPQGKKDEGLEVAAIRGVDDPLGVGKTDSACKRDRRLHVKHTVNESRVAGNCLGTAGAARCRTNLQGAVPVEH
jgi:hypothetical protein